MFESIAELAEINPPLRSRTPDRLDAPISFIPMGDVSESGQWLTRQTRPLREVKSGFTPFQEGDVLFAKITPCMENGKGAHAVGLENGVGYGSTEFHVLRAKADNSPRYIFHLSQSSSLRLKAEASMIGSAGQKRVPSDFFRKHRVFAPDRAEQRVVARILDTLDTQIQKTEALIAKLEKVKEGILHDLLTRGIDDNGQLRPSPEQAPELYKESPLGLIPREWCPKTIGQLSSSIVDGPFGSNLKTEHYVTEPGVRVVRLQNITPFEYDDTDRAFIKDGHAEALSKNIVQPEDVLIASLGDGTHPAGRACLYPSNLPEAINKADCFRLRADSGVATNSYIMLFMNSDIFAKQARKWTQGVTLQRINTTSLKKISISCPSLEEQKSISQKINKSLFLLATQKEELGKLKLKKQGLMDDLLTGRVRVTSLLDQAQATTPA